MAFESRNKPIGFAQRTRKNLEYVTAARDRGEDVHVVTHLVNSLLGIVIVPKAQYSGHDLWSVSLEELVRQGWPKWDITLDDSNGKTKKLKHLVRHLRNAAAHGHFEFTGEPESRNLSEVGLIVKDQPGENEKTNWKAKIGGPELYEFCVLLADRIEESIKSSSGTAGA